MTPQRLWLELGKGHFWGGAAAPKRGGWPHLGSQTHLHRAPGLCWVSAAAGGGVGPEAPSTIPLSSLNNGITRGGMPFPWRFLLLLCQPKRPRTYSRQDIFITSRVLLLFYQKHPVAAFGWASWMADNSCGCSSSSVLAPRSHSSVSHSTGMPGNIWEFTFNVWKWQSPLQMCLGRSEESKLSSCFVTKSALQRSYSS